MHKPFFTIIVLDSGDVELLQQSLQMITEQICSSWELIVSSSAAFDPALLDSCGFDSAVHNIGIVTHTSTNVAQRLNACIATACGEYIVFLRSGDVWSGVHLEVLLQHAKLYTECACYIVRALVYQSNSRGHLAGVKDIVHHPVGSASCYTVQDMLNGAYPKLSQLALRRTVWKEQQGFVENFPTCFLEKLCIDIYAPANMCIIDAFSVYIYEGFAGKCSKAIVREKELIAAHCAYTFKCFAPPPHPKAVELSGVCCTHRANTGAPYHAQQAGCCGKNTAARPAKNCLQLLFRASHLPYFDAQWYAKHYGIRFVPSFAHYCTVGWKKGYDPSPAFSTAHYLAAYPDVRRAKVNPLLHYVQSGLYEGRKP